MSEAQARRGFHPYRLRHFIVKALEPKNDVVIYGGVRAGHGKIRVKPDETRGARRLSYWIHNLPIGWMGLVYFGLAYLVAAIIYIFVIFYARRAHVHARVVSAGMLSPAGTLFALFVVFTAAQVWNDNDSANSAVAQEASSLRSVVLLAASFPGEPESQLTALVHENIQEAANVEWPMMAHQNATLNIVPRELDKALLLALSLKPSGQGQEIAQREMVSQLESALEARRQRILISRSSVSAVKWACLAIEAICVLLIVALVHCENRVAAAFSMALFATGAAACFFLIGAYDRAFVGKLAVSPAPLLQVMPETTRLSLEANQPRN